MNAAMNWKGVIPAITTNLDAAGAVDHAALGRHCEWLIRSGCTGIVCCGSLGEAATLSFDEKLAIAATCVRAVRTCASRARYRVAQYCRSRQARTRCRRGRMRRADGAAAVRVQHGLARDEGARQRNHRRNETVVHALQQSAGVQDRFPARADRRAGGGASESARREGVERRRAACDCDPRACCTIG